MMKTILLALLLSPILSFGQKFEFSGSIQQTNFYQGGVENIEEPKRYALPNFQLNLIQYLPGDSIPTIVKTFNSDSEGKFSFKLKPGTYAFAGFTDSLMAHQYLPQGSWPDNRLENWYGEMTTVGWSFLFESGPIVITDKDVKGIVLTRHTSTICGACP